MKWVLRPLRSVSSPIPDKNETSNNELNKEKKLKKLIFLITPNISQDIVSVNIKYILKMYGLSFGNRIEPFGDR